MKITLSITGLIIGISLSATAAVKPTAKEIKMAQQKVMTTELLKSIETGDAKPVGYINPTKYTQHNLGAEDGLAGFGKLLSQLPKGSAKVNTVRAFADGEYVFTHTEYNFFGPKAGFDIFRFENGKIVEHWDNLAEKTLPNPSGHTQTDGSTEIKDLNKTEKNKKFVADFVNTVLVKQKYDKSPEFISAENYTQHNSQIGDNLSGLQKALGELAKAGITMVYDKVHKVLGEGNFVLVVSEGKFGGKPTAFYDLFRVEGGKIVEHWDVLETIPPKDQWKNQNGKFGFKK